VPVCATFTDADLSLYLPIPGVDSLQLGLENQVRCGRFGSTACGESRGGYWDNLRVGFVRGGRTGPPIELTWWNMLGETFPFTEEIAPGSVQFDTTAALTKVIGGFTPADGGIRVQADTLECVSSWSGDDARMDFVFRVWPGPGNYAGRITGGGSQDAWELRHHHLLEIPSAGDLPGNYATAGDGSWWGAYMADNGLVGSKPSGHTSIYWDPQTWNSARMDSAQRNYSPIETRAIGLASLDRWMAAYHEEDPKFAAQGIARDLCFLVDPAGPEDNTNTCCSPAECTAPPFNTSWPPPGYDPSEPTSTTEGTKILPDGLFTPGTHIQYFLRRSSASAPLTMERIVPDTSLVTWASGSVSWDEVRFLHADVLPDMWKDRRFGGPGLACILYVDAYTDEGCEPSVRAALDSLGFGVDNGADRGWRQTTENWLNPDDPAGFVPEILGQAGLAYDKFDTFNGMLGCRIVGGSAPPEFTGRGCTLGPTADMLDFYYSTIVYDGCGGGMSGGALKEPSESEIILEWLNRAGPDQSKALWGMGEGLAYTLANSEGPTAGQLLNRMGALFLADSYQDVSGNRVSGMVFKPLDTDPGPGNPFHSNRRYGMMNYCYWALDVVDVDRGVLGAEPAGRYEDFTDRGTPGVGAGPYYASVYRRLDTGAGRYYATLLDGFTLYDLLSWNGASDPTTQNIPLTFNNHAQQAWMDDALSAFNLCSRVSPVIAVGEMPGISALNFVRGAVPNPSANGSATVQFTLAQAAKVTIRFYNVAGRQVHEATVEGQPGENAYRWNGATTSGLRATSGVYFYRLSAPGIEFENNHQRMVLLGQAD
jgi:hypothetical protein